jgi:hypothetical protein
MKDARIAVSALLVAVALAGAAALVFVRAEQSEVAQGAAAAAQELEKARSDASARLPDVPVSEAVHEDYSRKLEKSLDSAATDKARQSEMAANHFAGYMNVNVKTRVEYCRELGIDISAFASALAAGHTTELASAKAIHQRRGIDLESILAATKSQSRKTIEIDMQDIAGKIGGGTREARRVFADKAAQIANDMHISKVHPALHRALMQ